MADNTKKDNIKALFANTRTRIIILFTFILLVTTIVIGFIKFGKALNPLRVDSSVNQTPAAIQSIPGALNQTAQYAALQNQQNIQQAKIAERKGTSAIPTIIRSQAFGQGVEAIGATGGQGSIGFTSLARENLGGPQSTVWFQNLKDSQCSKEMVNQAVNQHNASMNDLILACTCGELKNVGYTLKDLVPICSCDELKGLGFGVMEFKAAGFSASALRSCGFVACQEHAAGFTAREMKNAGYSDGELKGAGFTDREIAAAGGLPNGMTAAEVLHAGCTIDQLQRLRAQGVTAAAIRRISGCSLARLKAAGFTAPEMKDAGYSAAELKQAGFTPEQLKEAGYTAGDLLRAGVSPKELSALGETPAEVALAEKNARGLMLPAGVTNCSPESLKLAKQDGVSAATIRQTLGCDAEALKNAGYGALPLKEAGFSAAELKNAGFTPSDLKNAGFNARDLRAAGVSAGELKNLGFDAAGLQDAGFDAPELKAAGFTAAQLKAAGFGAPALKAAGFDASELKDAGFPAKALKDAGFTATQLKHAGFNSNELINAGFSPEDSALADLNQAIPIQSQPSTLGGIPSITGGPTAIAEQRKAEAQAENAKRLAEIMKRQQALQNDQRFQQKIQQRTSLMLSAANQVMLPWKTTSTQQYVAGKEKEHANSGSGSSDDKLVGLGLGKGGAGSEDDDKTILIHMGDVLFAVIDTAVNSDEPGPILATIVSGKLEGAKLIGSFNLPSNADKMVISFKALSIQGAPKTLSISAFAIDPNTARTALSSETNHHYLMRYGSLFASTFLEGFGNAFQSADTSITIGGTGGVQDTTVQNGIGRSALENAVIGLATLGKAWGQVAQKNMSRPTTVQVYSGTAVGVLFTQDLKIS